MPRILVVEDEAHIAQGLQYNLEAEGLAVEVASDGRSAVERLSEGGEPVDLVVLDMIMDPGIDGLDTYKKIIEIHPGQSAIITSGFSKSERVAKAQELGAGAYVKKPYVMEKLGLAIRTALNKG